MQNLVPEGNWKMAAILGMNDNQVEEICKKVTSGFVTVANYNCPGQVAVSGEEKAVEELANIAKESGAKRAVVLNTSGPFHTMKLNAASEALREELENVVMHKFKSNVIKNLDGMPYKVEDNIHEILAKHIVSPVKFSETLQTMLDEGVGTFIEIGPGKTLSGFVKRMKPQKEINILNINDVKTLESTINFIKGENK